jgi:starch synthase
LTEWEIKSRKVNFLLEGISHADVVTTVSDTYAKEILTEELGESLDRVLEDKKDHLFGILNGIDIDWIDNLYKNAVSYPYVKTNAWEEGKRLNKLHLQKELGLLVKSGVPLFSFIGRFDPHQKGIDILHKMLKRISHTKYEFVILGTGDVNWEERFQWLGKFFPKNISCHFRFDEVLAHKIYAASDFILIPSRFEPCGLIQMIAMYFGTLPIAHKTGGLSDSIKDGYNGFLFKRYTCEALRKTVEAAVDIWQNDKPRYRKMVENALSADFSWKKSAGKYLELYNKLIKESL